MYYIISSNVIPTSNNNVIYPPHHRQYDETKNYFMYIPMQKLLFLSKFMFCIAEEEDEINFDVIMHFKNLQVLFSVQLDNNLTELFLNEESTSFEFSIHCKLFVITLYGCLYLFRINCQPFTPYHKDSIIFNACSLENCLGRTFKRFC